MKKASQILLLISLSILNTYGQNNDDLSAIKLFLGRAHVSQANEPVDYSLEDRLARRMTQLINEIGVVEIGYSTFLVLPRLEVVSTSVSQAGISSVYMAECELFLSIERVSFGSDGGATFSSFSKNIIGSGSSKKEAVSNAISNLSPKDTKIVEFLTESKQKINVYFQTHCNDVIKEAERALALKQYTRSIALYFSIPINAPCYNAAFEKSKGVYQTYIEDECNKKIVMLNSYVALAQIDSKTDKSYDSVMTIMESLSPASPKCFAEAKKQIEKIENRLNAQQKEMWEVKKKISLSAPEVEKEMYKAMRKISSSYQPPPPSTNVIIAH